MEREIVTVEDDMGHSIDIPKKDYEKMKSKCGKCEARAVYAITFKMPIDYINCPYSCSNSLYHYRIMHPERARYE